ncbi:hypothetical protein SEVIR_9G306901v4 [Setaria viridis]|uniref:Uncharacterized protein n=1 Tax=Setaria italica TaxID=4555 RepID=K4AHU5_SETIT
MDCTAVALTSTKCGTTRRSRGGRSEQPVEVKQVAIDVVPPSYANKLLRMLLDIKLGLAQ